MGAPDWSSAFVLGRLGLVLGRGFGLLLGLFLLGLWFVRGLGLGGRFLVLGFFREIGGSRQIVAFFRDDRDRDSNRDVLGAITADDLCEHTVVLSLDVHRRLVGFNLK